MEYHYLRLANELEQKIRSGKYRAGKYTTGEYIGYGHPLGLQGLRTEIAKRSVGLYDQGFGEEIRLPFCSGTNRYRHCLRLNCGYPLDERSEAGIDTLGRLIGELIRKE